MQKFAVYNPLDGMYKLFDTIEETVVAATEVAFAMYSNYVHDAPFSVVDIADNGAETWSTPAGDIYDSPTQIKAKLERQIRQMQAFANAGAIQVTTL